PFKVSYGAIPETIWLYRNGASEGQFPVLLNKEIPAVLPGRPRGDQGSLPTRSSFILLEASATLQNVRPGTVIDNGIVCAFSQRILLERSSGFPGNGEGAEIHNPSNGSHGNVDLEDIEVLNKEMVYSGRQLSKVRFNA
ncbi:unnamed protein product, partial [Mesorhabditis spiculigera]